VVREWWWSLDSGRQRGDGGTAIAASGKQGQRGQLASRRGSLRELMTRGRTHGSHCPCRVTSHMIGDPIENRFSFFTCSEMFCHNFYRIRFVKKLNANS
jgi:hypothetical protein